jgi:murein L,D-transpeptidase YcbB/YkuD
MTRRRLPLLGLLLLAGALVHGCQSAETDREIAQLIRGQIQPAGWFPKRATVDDDDMQPLVRRFYKARRYQPAWTHIDGPTNDARELLKSLVRSARKGSIQRPRREIAALDLELTRNFLKNATHRFSGQVQPMQLSPDWHVKPRTQDMVPVLAEAIGTHRIDPTLASLSPRNPQYARLREALAEYRRIEQQGGWPMVRPGPALKRGSAGARVDSRSGG